MARVSSRNETSMRQVGMVFGININTLLDKWMAKVFTPNFKSMHADEEFAGFIIEPGIKFDPVTTPMSEVLIFSTSYDYDVYMGLLQNVRHKACYSLRTGIDSSTALSNLHLVVPGDFVYDGFVCHRGIKAGGSGVRKEFDVVYVREIVDKYIELRTAVVAEVLDLIKWVKENRDKLPVRPDTEGDIASWKYLDGSLELLDIWREIRKQRIG